MKRRLQIAFLIAIGLCSILVYSHFTGDLKVDHFVEHTLQEGETLEDVLVHYNPVMQDETVSLRAELAEELKLLNPHTELYNAGTQIVVPVFVY